MPDARKTWTIVMGAIALAASAQAQPLGRAELAPGVTLEITRLAQLPGHGIVELRLAVANGSAETVTLERLRLGTTYALSEVQLLDFANAAVYKIGEAGTDRLASRWRDGGPVAPGERRELWAWYKAPPAGVAKLAVMVPGIPPVLDVPLAR
jgi:hypothetical protein